MQRLLVATSNPAKLREIRAALADIPVEFVSLLDLSPVPEPEETGATFQENATLKARYYDAALSARGGDVKVGSYTVAEDSGLVIDALDGEPGVRSARFLRPDASYAERFAELYRRLAERAARPRHARFVCALAVVRDGEVRYETTGVVEGEIAAAPRGSAGFGYDPIFYYPPCRCTLGEMPENDKLRVSHRGQAFRRLAEWLQSLRATGS